MGGGGKGRRAKTNTFLGPNCSSLLFFRVACVVLLWLLNMACFLFVMRVDVPFLVCVLFRRLFCGLFVALLFQHGMLVFDFCIWHGIVVCL